MNKDEVKVWQDVFYFVGVRRKDETAPSIVKAVDGKFFMSVDEAKPLLAEVTNTIGNYYGIFQGVALVAWLPPVQL